MRAIPVGLVGAGRTRNGLGPFLARFLEQGGARVVAVSGRNRERAAVAAAELEGILGHEVSACADPAELCGSGIEALVAASPARHHVEALEAALAAGLPTLCEKPLVVREQRDHGERIVAGFRAAELLLMESCQWPHALGALWELHPGLREDPVREIAMGLSPAAAGLAMVEDSLSHFLSVVQALLPVGPETELAEVAFSDRDPRARATTLHLTLQNPFPPVRGRFELRVHAEQPRPAWLALNGRRMDRVILSPGYRIAFEAGGRTVPIDDPTATLVYGFAGSIREPGIERIRNEAASVAERLRLYCGILDRWDHPAG